MNEIEELKHRLDIIQDIVLFLADMVKEILDAWRELSDIRRSDNAQLLKETMELALKLNYYTEELNRHRENTPIHYSNKKYNNKLSNIYKYD